LIVDEIDTSLHPDLCAAIVNLFTDPRTNPNGAQLLFSTHERDLLNHLRRDEVVLVDKGRDGASRLSVASDFDVRGRQELRRVHAEGRLGGVPVLADLRAAWAKRAPDGA
jgi:predicted ATPase